MTFDPTVHLGDLLMTAAVGGMGWTFRKLYTALTHFVARVDRHGEIIDEHSLILEDKGLATHRLPRVRRFDPRP